MARTISKILLILGWYNFLAYLECVRSYAWSKGHSEPDLGNVGQLNTGSYFAINLVTFLALNLIQHVIAIEPIRNLDTG